MPTSSWGVSRRSGFPPCWVLCCQAGEPDRRLGRPSILCCGTRTKRGIMMKDNGLRSVAMAVIAGMVIVAGGVALAGTGEGTPSRDGVDAKATFARLKKLVGTWKVDLDATGKAADFKKKVEKHREGHAKETVIFK